MIFVFSEEKALQQGYTAQACYEVVDKIFARYGISPVAQGEYEAPDNQNTFTAFGITQKLPYTNWFLKIIDTWTCANEDGIPEDCLQVFYNVENRNKQED